MSATLPPTPEKSNAVPTEDLINELQRLADELGDAPTAVHMTEAGRYGTGTYYRRFDNWADALDHAGLEPRREASTEKLQQAGLRGSLVARHERCPYCGQAVDDGGDGQ